MTPPRTSTSNGARKVAGNRAKASAKAKVKAARQEDPRDPALLAGYATLLSGYGALAGVVTWAAARRGRSVRDLSALELLTYGLATQHLSRLITKDSITALVRAPFTEFNEPAGEGEVNEEPVGTGLRHAVGELLTCPFCVGQWVATALVAGRVLAPGLTTAVVSV
ncbi:MAG: DUF1360 domain-containing protein, partial [Acidimicrobiales bacterium]